MWLEGLKRRLLPKTEPQEAATPSPVMLSPRAQEWQALILSIQDNNLLRDLRASSEGINQLAVVCDELGASGRLDYLAQGSTAFVLRMEGNRVLKLSRPTVGDELVETLGESKNLLLLPLESEQFMCPGRTQDTVKAEVYPRVLMLNEVMGILEARDPDFDKRAFADQLQQYKLILSNVFIREGILNSDINNGSLGFVTMPDGKLITITDQGKEHFVPAIVDYEKLGCIPSEYMGRYAGITEAPIPDIVSRWCEAKKTAEGAYKELHEEEKLRISTVSGNSSMAAARKDAEGVSGGITHLGGASLCDTTINDIASSGNHNVTRKHCDSPSPG